MWHQFHTCRMVFENNLGSSCEKSDLVFLLNKTSSSNFAIIELVGYWLPKWVPNIYSNIVAWLKGTSCYGIKGVILDCLEDSTIPTTDVLQFFVTIYLIKYCITTIYIFRKWGLTVSNSIVQNSNRWKIKYAILFLDQTFLWIILCQTWVIYRYSIQQQTKALFTELFINLFV